MARGDAGEGVTVAVLHERYLEDIYRYVARRVARREEAEDVTAEVFAAAFVELSRFRGECPPNLWLLGIARRKVADSLRRRASRREMLASEIPEEPEQEAVADAPLEVLEQAEALRFVRGLVDGLKEEQREALLLQYVEGLSIAEIAVVMRRSPAAVNSLLQRARANLYRQGRGYFLGVEEEMR